MNNREKELITEWMIDTTKRLQTIQERIESGGGSGATDCYAGREAGKEQDEAQGRSREDRRVTPGEARHALEWAAGEAMIKADFHEVQAAHAMQGGRTGLRNLHKEKEAAFRKMAYALCNLMPKPDSEAVEDERSGRRNDQAHLPAPAETVERKKDTL